MAQCSAVQCILLILDHWQQLAEYALSLPLGLFFGMKEA